MTKRKITYSLAYPKGQRSYFVNDDNANSRMRVSCISNFKSINDIMQDRELTKALVVDNFFDTSYIKKIKKEAVSYPVSKELEK